MTVTSGLISREIHAPLMDVRAVNQLAERDCFRLDGDLDIFTRDLQALADEGVPLPIFRPLVTDLLEVRRVEAQIETEVLTEGRGELRILGFTDRLVTDLRDLECNAQANGRIGALSARGIARTLREPLRVMSNPSAHRASRVVRAGRTITDAINSVPRVHLLSAPIRRDLGERLFALLEDIVNDRGRPEAAAGQPSRGRRHGAT